MAPAERWDDRGQVTAEMAVALPSALLVLGMLMWGLATASAQVKCVDGAREGARAAARGEPAATVLRVARAAAPEGTEVEVSRKDGLVHVRVRAESPGPGPLALPLRSHAVAMAEPSGEAAR